MPFRRPVIGYPVGIDPMLPQWAQIRAHELVHARQQRGFGLLGCFLLYFFLPLPVFFSGRWFIEREAYLVDLRAGTRTIDQVVDTLWSQYFFPWPRSWMRDWFDRRVNRAF